MPPRGAMTRSRLVEGLASFTFGLPLLSPLEVLARPAPLLIYPGLSVYPSARAPKKSH